MPETLIHDSIFKAIDMIKIELLNLLWQYRYQIIGFFIFAFLVRLLSRAIYRSTYDLNTFAGKTKRESRSSAKKAVNFFELLTHISDICGNLKK